MLFLSAIYSTLQVYLNVQQIEVSASTATLWMFVFAMLIAFWANKEPKQKEFEGTFEFPALVYFVWPIVMPYYLVKTRGLEGLVVYMGFIAIYFSPDIMGWVAYLNYE